MFPYLDIPGFKLRTAMQPGDVDVLESTSRGFLAQCIADASDYVNSRLRKRYGNATTADNTPFGKQAPILLAAGTAPPAVSLTGRPVLGSMRVGITITTGGIVGTAVFTWSSDAGLTPHAGVVTAPAVVLGSTGLTAIFPAGTYATDNVYAAGTPVPPSVLKWVASLAAFEAYVRRGIDPSGFVAQAVKDRADQAKVDLKEAADSKDGLFDLPLNEDADSAIVTGGPFVYSEASPYVAFDLQACQGRAEDQAGRGSP